MRTTIVANTTRQSNMLKVAKMKKDVASQDMDSSLPELFRTGVPHRLPLPPLLAAPTPKRGDAFLTGISHGSIKPVARRPLAPNPSLTIADATEGKSEVHVLGGPRSLNKSQVSDLKMLSLACIRASRPLAEALCYWNIAVEYESAYTCGDAISYFRKFINPCVRSGYTPGVVSGLSCVSASLYCLGNYTEAVAAAETALELVPDACHLCETTTGGWVTPSYAAASLLNTIGLCFAQILDYEAATVAFSRALQHALQVPDQSVEKAICANQAAANALVGDFKKAESCLDRHLELTGAITNIAETNVEKTLGFHALEENNMKIEPIGTKMSYKQASDAVETSSVLSKMGSLARIHGDIDASRQFYQRAYNLAVRGGSYEHAVTASCAIGVAKGNAEMSSVITGINVCQRGIEDADDVDPTLFEHEVEH